MVCISNLKKNFLYNTAYQMLIIATPLITTPYISRVLGAEGLGRYSYALSVVTYFAMFALMGVNNYGNREIALVRDDKQKLSKTFCSIYAFQIVCSIIMIGIYAIYIYAFSNDRIMGCIMMINLLSCTMDINWFFFGLEKFKVTVTRNIIIKILLIIAIFVFIKEPTDVYKYALIYWIGHMIAQLYLVVILKRYVHIVKIRWKDIFPHIMPNLILFIPVVAMTLYKQMDKTMLGSFTNMSEVGFYEACEKVIVIPTALITSLGTVMLPRMSNMLANNEIDKSKKYISKSILIAMFFSTLICFGIMAVAKEFVPLFYGEGYEKCIILFQILLPSSIFIAFSNVIRTQYLIPNKQDHIFVVSVIMGAVMNLIINIALIPRYAAIGAAIGTLCAECAVWGYQCYAVRMKLNIKTYILNSVPYLMAGILMYLCLIKIDFNLVNTMILLIIKIGLGGVIYITSFLIIQVIFKIIFQYIRR